MILPSYYMLCIGSTPSGNISLSINADVREFTEKTASSSSGTNEIQQIDVGANITSEHQVRNTGEAVWKWLETPLGRQTTVIVDFLSDLIVGIAPDS